MSARCTLRRLLHACLLVVGWGGFFLLWLHALANGGQVLRLAIWILAGVILIAVGTAFWVAHLLSIALQKTPRLQHAVTVALYVRDRLERPVHAPWPELRQLRSIDISIDASGKHYQAGRFAVDGQPGKPRTWEP